jgi:hypothetical protein
MIWITAVANTAFVMQLEAIRHRTNQQLEDKAMTERMLA